MNRTRIKMCGMTTAREVALAVEAGADAIGMILAPSPRRVDRVSLPELVRAVPPYVDAIAVLADPSDDDARAASDLGCTLQFSGHETAMQCDRLARHLPYIKAFHVGGHQRTTADALEKEFPGALWMFDAHVDGSFGGTGTAFAWEMVAPIAQRRPIVVSGGLTSENVGACVRRVRPFAVDVRSGLETDGKKDADKLRAFVRAVRIADET